MINFLSIKSRFHFYVSLKNIINFLFDLIKFTKNKNENLDKELLYFFPKSSFLYFDHGRTAFYFLLLNLKAKTQKRKILINSLTLFEMVNMIIYAGFEPVFIDNEENSFKTNSINVLEKYKNDVAAIVVTHLNGFNEDVLKIKEYTKNLDNKIYIIEDCAVSFGAKKDDEYIGNLGDFSILSFNIMKNITSFTGGVLITNDKDFNFEKNIQILNKNSKLDLAFKALFVILLKILNSKLIFPIFFIFIRYSYKYSFNFFLKKYRTDFIVSIEEKIPSKFLKSLDNSQIRLIKEQFKFLEKDHELRINNSKYYFDNLKNVNGLNFPQQNFNKQNLFIEFPLICKDQSYKEKIWSKSLSCFIDLKNYYYKSCSEEKIYSVYTHDEKKSNSNQISKNILMLPVHPKMTKIDLDKIISLIKSI